MTRHSTYLKRREKLAAYLEQLPREEFDIEDIERCVIGHGHQLFKLSEVGSLDEHLGIAPCGDLNELYSKLIFCHTPVKAPKQAAKYIRQHLMGEQ